MSSLTPVVLGAHSIEQFIQYALDHHAPPSTLVVCSSKSDFLTDLVTAVGDDTVAEQQARRIRSLLRDPVLRLLSTSSTIKLAFCPDVTHLRAYLATYAQRLRSEPPQRDSALRRPTAVPLLAVLNTIQLHRPTSAFSAQGLNRTLSVAVDAAYQTGSKLVVCEVAAIAPYAPVDPNAEAPLSPQTLKSPWDEELSILNVTTKRLGEMSVGRTVRAYTVASRWCTFEDLPAPEASDNDENSQGHAGE